MSPGFIKRFFKVVIIRNDLLEKFSLQLNFEEWIDTTEMTGQNIILPLIQSILGMCQALHKIVGILQ